MLPLGGGAVLQPTAFDSSNRGKDGGASKAALIESLSFNKLGKGTRLLGLVRDVAPDYAVVSLPNMLTGFVRRAKATDIALTDVYTPGTMMAFSIVKTTTETVASSSSSSSGSSSANGKAKTETRRRIELLPRFCLKDTLYGVGGRRTCVRALVFRNFVTIES